jgi:hypothetical protein
LFIWKYLNSSSFLKSSFGRYKIPGWQVLVGWLVWFGFLALCIKYQPTYLLASKVSDK